MALDFNLLNTNIPAEAANNVGKGMQQVNALTAQRLQNQASNMQMQNALAEQEIYRNSNTPEEAQRNLMRGGFGKSSMAIGQSLAAQDKARADVIQSETSAQKSRFEINSKITAQDLEQQREAIKSIVFNPSNENIQAYLQDGVLRKKITPEDAQQQFAIVANMPPAQRKEYFTMLGTKGEEYFKQISSANAPTTEMKNYQFGKQDPGFLQNQMQLKRAGATTVHLPPQPRAEQEARGRLLVDDYKTVSASARNAAKTLPAIDTNLNILDKGFKTGFTTETQAGAASILSALGISDAKDFATNAQIFKAKTNDIVLQKQLEQKGVQTAADADRITSTGAQLGNTPEANRFLLDVAKAQLKRDIDQRNYYDKWWEKNKTYDGAENSWYATEGDKSLFERPELKKYSVGATKPSAPKTTKSGASVSNW